MTFITERLRATKDSSANHKIYKILHHKIYLEEQKNLILENRRFMENLIIVSKK